MASNELDVIISSKVDGSGFKEAAKGLESVRKESEDAAKAAGAATDAIGDGAKRASRGFGVFTRSLQDQIRYENDFTRSVRNGTLAIGANIQAARQAASGFRQVGPPLQNATKQAGSADAAFVNLGRVASDLPFGFIAIQNNLDPLVQSFSRIFQQSNSVGEGFKTIGRSLIGGAGLGLAFSVVNSAITVAIQKYGSIGAAIDAFLGKIDHQGNVIKNAAKDVGSEIAQLELLRTKFSDLNASQAERTKALDAYNKIADNANKINKKDIDNLGEINRLLNQQIQLLQDRAIAAAAQKELEEAAGKLFEVQRKTLPILNRATQALQDQSDEAAEATKNVKNLRIATEEEAAASPGFAAAATQDLKEVAAIRNSAEYKQAQKELQAAQQEFNKILGDVADLVTFDGVSDKDTSKTKKNTKTISGVLKELEAELIAVDVKTQAVGATMQEIASDKIKAFEKAISDLLKLGVEPSSQFFTDFRKRIDEIQSFLKVTTQREPVTVPIVTEPVFQLGKTTTAIKGLTDNFDHVFKTIAEQFNKITESAVEGAVSDISDAFGAALITGDFGNIFKVLATSIGSYLQELGKVLVATGIGIEAFKKSLESLQGIPAIVAGAALIAAGGAFKALAAQGPSFATGGGIIGGPRLVTMGDNPGREEYAIPSEILDKMNGGAPIDVETRISGNDLLILLRRTEKENKR